MGDMISRAELFNRLATVKDLGEAFAVIQGMPTKEGHWDERIIEDGDPFSRRRWYCSHCGSWQTYGGTKFCPMCGADMRGKT